MIRLILTLIVFLALAGQVDAKYIIVDDTGTVQDIASHKENLSRGYQFKSPKVYKISNNLIVDILDKYDGKKVTRYQGTEKQRHLSLLNYAIIRMEQQILVAPTEKDRIEWQQSLDSLRAKQVELSK